MIASVPAWSAVLVAALVLVVLVPYLASRLAASRRRLSVHGPGEPPARPPGPSGPLRILSYNIAHGRGPVQSNRAGGGPARRRKRLDDIAALLRKADADIVVLNEVDFNSSWSHGVNQARYLAEQAGYPYRVEQRNMDLRLLTWTLSCGNAVLSRWPVRSAECFDLPEYSAIEAVLAGTKRGIACCVDVDGRPLHVLATHLSYRSESVRVRSAEHLLHRAAQSEHPAVLVGDMNSAPPGCCGGQVDGTGRNALAVLRASDDLTHFEPTPNTGLPPTFPAPDPGKAIDWILVPAGWRFEEYEVIACDLSDHRPVCASVVPGEGRV
jgi:endonuclease/exonuclease/phosphatase family metal-dependent hydrolase